MAISLVSTALVFSLTAKISDTWFDNDSSTEESVEDDLVTLEPTDEPTGDTTEQSTEEPTDEPADVPTDEPTEPEVIPTAWKYVVGGYDQGPLVSEARSWQYALTDELITIVDGDYSTAREYTAEGANTLQCDVITYGFGTDGTSYIIEAPTSFRVAYTCWVDHEATTYVYQVVDYPAGVHTLAIPSNASDVALTVSVTYPIS